MLRCGGSSILVPARPVCPAISWARFVQNGKLIFEACPSRREIHPSIKERLLMCGIVGQGHRRLSIDLSENAAQPMANEDGTLCVTFNGEIYNHAEIRAE